MPVRLKSAKYDTILTSCRSKGFSSAAELYQQVRPNYPVEIVSWLQDRLQIHENSTVIDLGSGTGKFLPYLKQTHANIIAVEPIGEMLQQLQQAYPDIKTLQAFSHNIPVNDQQIDAVICAQSFHWFDNIETLTEIHRVLKPQGHLGLVWNQRDESTDWVKALADFYYHSKVIHLVTIVKGGKRF